VIHYVDFEKLNKRFWLLDTYEGLVDRLISQDERRRGILPGGYEPCYEQVVETFRSFRGVEIVRGVVPDTLPQVKAAAICYLSIDMNNAAPEIAAAEHFWERLVPGGMVVLDDYGWRKQANQKIAFDRFAEARNVKVLSLPTGQGLLIKP
jgi:O-methyltransferase